jgi:hypothetical protein
MTEIIETGRILSNGDEGKLMREALKKTFIPRLRKMGFKGSLPNFKREKDTIIDAVFVQFDHRQGGKFTTNIERTKDERAVAYFRVARYGHDFWYSYDRPNLGLKDKYEYLTQRLMDDFNIAEEFFRTGETPQPQILTIEQEKDVLRNTPDQELEWRLYDLALGGTDINQFAIGKEGSPLNIIERYPEWMQSVLFTIDFEISFYQQGMTGATVFKPEILPYAIVGYEMLGASKRAQIAERAKVLLAKHSQQDLMRIWYKNEDTSLQQEINKLHDQFFKLTYGSGIKALFGSKEDISVLRTNFIKEHLIER